MQQHKFRSNKAYVRAQRTITLRKFAEENPRMFVLPETVNTIRRCYPSQAGVFNGLCHGVRNGDELDLFQSAFSRHSLWIGTEIVKELCDDERILNMDFSEVRKGWIGSFDLIYSNSLDHARDPYRTVRAWLSCLAPEGKLYVEWTKWHDKLGRRGNRADCFAATFQEYDDLFSSAGRVADILSVPGDVVRRIFVVY